jgi:hypothetical protein
LKTLANTYPHLLEEWDYEKNHSLIPEEVAPHSNRKAWWKCKYCEKTWIAIIQGRTKNLQEGCRECVHRLKHVTSTYNLAYCYPAVADQWNYEKNGYLKPEELAPYSNIKVWWKDDTCGHEWEAIISTRTIQKAACRKCAYRDIERDLPYKYTFAQKYPHLVKFWHPTLNGKLTPEGISQKANHKVWWQCEKNSKHVWDATIAAFTSAPGCPYCKGRRVLPEESLVAYWPDVSKFWNYEKNGELTPDKVSLHSGKRVWWKCKANKECGHQWEVAIYSVVRNSFKCKKCRVPFRSGPITKGAQNNE